MRPTPRPCAQKCAQSLRADEDHVFHKRHGADHELDGADHELHSADRNATALPGRNLTISYRPSAVRHGQIEGCLPSILAFIFNAFADQTLNPGRIDRRHLSGQERCFRGFLISQERFVFVTFASIEVAQAAAPARMHFQPAWNFVVFQRRTGIAHDDFCALIAKQLEGADQLKRRV